MKRKLLLVIGLLIVVFVANAAGFGFGIMVAGVVLFWVFLIGKAILGAMRMGAEDAERMRQGKPPKWPPYIK